MDTKKILYKSNSKQHLFFEADGKSQCLAPGQTIECSETDQLKTLVAKKSLSVVTAADLEAEKTVNPASDATADVEEGTEELDLSNMKFEPLVELAKKRNVDVTGLKSKEDVRNAIEMAECEKFAELHEADLTAFVTENNISKPENAKEFKEIIALFKAEVLNKKD